MDDLISSQFTIVGRLYFYHPHCHFAAEHVAHRVPHMHAVECGGGRYGVFHNYYLS